MKKIIKKTEEKEENKNASSYYFRPDEVMNHLEENVVMAEEVIKQELPILDDSLPSDIYL